MYEKSIVYDRETRDYAMYLDSELVGFARTYHEAEVTLDQLVFELMTGQHFKNFPTGEVAPPPIDEPQPIADESNACAGFGCVDGCGDCEAATTTSIITTDPMAFIADEVSDGQCPACGEPGHSAQKCPDIRDLLFAEPVVMVPDVEYAPFGFAA